MTPDQETEEQERVVYLLTIRCDDGHENKIAFEDYWLPPERSSPWPVNLEVCPTCGIPVSPTDVVMDQEASIVEYPEVPPGER